MVNQSDAETQPEATGVSHFTAEVTNGTNEEGGGAMTWHLLYSRDTDEALCTWYHINASNVLAIEPLNLAYG